MLDQRGDVVAALAQRRDVERNDVQAVEQVLAERALLDHRLERAVRRRDHAHVHGDVRVAAEAAERVVLQHAQQLHLEPAG